MNDIELKSVSYEVQLFYSPTQDDLFISRWKTPGSSWKTMSRAPKELKQFANGNMVINRFRKCRSGKFFCGTVTVTSKITRMGIWKRRNKLNGADSS